MVLTFAVNLNISCPLTIESRPLISVRVCARTKRRRAARDSPSDRVRFPVRSTQIIATRQFRSTARTRNNPSDLMTEYRVVRSSVYTVDISRERHRNKNEMFIRIFRRSEPAACSFFASLGFLGVACPLNGINELYVYVNEKSRWYRLANKKKKKRKNMYGSIKIRFFFTRGAAV